MSFDRAWVLLLAPMPLLWLALTWRRTERRWGLALKAASLLAVILALSEPRLDTFETKVGAVVLVDTSASVSAKDLAKAASIVGGLEAERGRHWMRVMPFAREPRDLAPEETAKGLAFRRTAGEGGRSTDLEAAIRDAAGSIPAGMVPRVVLMSDGKENRGSAARAAWQAQQQGIPVDTYALDGRPKPLLRLESVASPVTVFTGERFPIDIVVSTPRATKVKVDLVAEGKPIGEQQLELAAGESRVRLHASLGIGGAVELQGRVAAEGLGEVRFTQAVTLRRPRLLYLSQDPPGSGAHLLNVLKASQFDVDQAGAAPLKSVDAYQAVVLNNWDLEALPGAFKADLETFVQQGGGVLVIGGERNIYVENKSIEDGMDRLLPAKLAPPRSPEGTCLVLIVDKSSSMEGKKMELARLASIGVVENLRSIDLVGVLIFDNSFQWAIPIRKAEDRQLMKRLIAGVTPDGGTQIAPALAEAYRKIVPIQATFKHIVLLTDGISEEGDSLALSKEAQQQKVTISTVGLGQDVNRAYLEKIAVNAKGRAHFLTDPAGLEQILLRDVMEHTGSTAVEKPLTPQVMHRTEILEGVGMESAPALKGYVRFTSKPSADTVLGMDQKDPLLVRWQYGLGRAAVFTSDAKARWAADWVAWKGFDRFWANVFRDLLPHTQPVDATLQYDQASGELVAEYRLSRQVPEPARIPDIFVVGPGSFRKPLPVKKVAQGSYRGAVAIGGQRGLFRVRPLEESRAFPEVGFYRQEEEMIDYGSDPELLKRISTFTGGRFQPEASQVFNAGGRAIPAALNLWPGLLAAAVALNIAELVNRKWRGLVDFFRRR
jgi:Ca-activated chloride channel homolog